MEVLAQQSAVSKAECGREQCIKCCICHSLQAFEVVRGVVEVRFEANLQVEVGEDCHRAQPQTRDWLNHRYLQHTLFEQNPEKWALLASMSDPVPGGGGPSRSDATYSRKGLASGFQ